MDYLTNYSYLVIFLRTSFNVFFIDNIFIRTQFFLQKTEKIKITCKKIVFFVHNGRAKSLLKILQRKICSTKICKHRANSKLHNFQVFRFITQWRGMWKSLRGGWKVACRACINLFLNNITNTRENNAHTHI